jgi:type II secretory pathway component PulF
MPEFFCKLVTEDGNVIETTIIADSKFEVYEITEKRNELLLSVEEHKESFNFSGIMNRFRRVKAQELENFTAQLAIMLRAGIPLLGSLESLVDQAETDYMKEVTEGVIEKVNSGMALSEALGSYPNVFGTLYVNMISAGETAGVLDSILDRLTGFIRHDLEVTKNIKAAMRYPLIVFTALFLAFTGAVIFIIPKFATMFTAQGIELPLPTKVMIGISDLVINYWWMAILGIVVLISSLVYYIRTPAGAYMFDLFKLKVPVFKDIILKSTVARFAHMLETLSKGGIQIIKALETTELTVGNLVIAKVISDARERVSEGISLGDALSKSKYFPKMTVKMISVGEKSGALDEMLANVALQYDNAVDEKIKTLSASIEPIMTVMMGVMLLFIALGIFLPMWNMYSAF